jgi:hypothetical protein
VVPVEESKTVATHATSSTTDHGAVIITANKDSGETKSSSAGKDQSQTESGSLWDRAYDKAGEDDPELVKKYEKLLSKLLDGDCEC